MALCRAVEIGLLEHERHPENTLPEVDRRLPVCPDQRDVMDALALKLAQWVLLKRVPASLPRGTRRCKAAARSAFDQLRLVLAPGQRSPGHELDMCVDDQD